MSDYTTELCIPHALFVLCTGLMNELAKQGLLGDKQSNLPATAGLDPSVCFHVAPYTETLLQALGKSRLGGMHCSVSYKDQHLY